MVLLLALSCAPEPAPEVDAASCETGETYIAVVNSLLFARATGSVSDGFDLDGVVTTAGAPTGCGVADYTSPRGVPGIDNAFALLVPALEATEAVAAEGLIEDAIHNGELLMMFSLSGVDDLTDDPCVGFTFEGGSGEPLLGADGEIEWHQTFDHDPAVPPVTVSDVVLADGRLEARGITFDLPLSVLDVTLLLHFEGGAFAVEPQPDGSFRGVFAGTLQRSMLMSIVSDNGVADEVATLLEGLLEFASDYDADGDGVCEQITGTFQFTAVPAFFFDATSMPP